MTLDVLGAGATVLVATLLVLSGAGKVASPEHVAAAVLRLVSDRVRSRHPFSRFQVAGRLFGLLEVGLGAALLVNRAVLPVRAATLVLCIAFVGVVALAVRAGSQCGCFASFSDGPAAGAELARAAVVALLALGALVAAGGDDPADPLSAAAVATAAALLGVMAAAMAVGGRLLPARAVGGDEPSGTWWVSVAGGVRSRRVVPGVPPAAEVLVGRDREAVVAQLQADAGVAGVVDMLAERGCSPQWAKAAVQRAANAAGQQMTVVAVPTRPEGTLRVMVVERPGHSTRVVASAEVAGELIA